MAVAREELEKGGRVFLRTRLSYGGAAVAEKLKPARVLKIERQAVRIALTDEKDRELVVPFNQLVADDGFLDERDKREAEKIARIQRERVESERVLAHAAPPTLKASFGDKLRVFMGEPDPDDDDGMPLDAAAQAQLRDDALRQLAELAALSRVEPTSERIATVHAIRPDEPSEPEPAPQPTPAAPAQPIPAPQPEPQPAPVPAELPPAQPPKPAPERLPLPEHQQPPLPLDAMSAMLQRIQGEFEKLISEEVRLEALHADALKALADLDALKAQADAAARELDAVRARQRVLSAQERQVLAVASVKPAITPAEVTVPAPQPAPPTPAPMPIAEPQRPLDAGLHGSEVLRAHDVEKRRPGRPLGSKSKPKPKPAEPLARVRDAIHQPELPSTTQAPGWLRHRPGVISGGVMASRRGHRADPSDPLERAIDDIVRAKQGRAS